MELLQNKNMVNGLPKLNCKEIACSYCLRGKQHRNSILKKSQWRAKQRLELIHIDLCGPIKPVSNGGKRYILNLIDDFTRKTWIYFLVEKFEAPHYFKIFKKP